MIASLFSILLLGSVPQGVRNIQASSCDVIRLNLALGMTSEIVFEEEPTLTLHADQEHFKIKTNPNAKRTIAIIPFVDASTMGRLFGNEGEEAIIPSGKALANKLDKTLTTNLFVFFKNSNQLMFELHFVEKPKADYVLNVKQIFGGDCNL